METLCWLVRQYVYTLPLNKQFFTLAKLLQKSEMRKDIVIELSYKGFG